MKRTLLAAGGALVAMLVISTTALACGFSQVAIAQTMREADRIVLGTVRERTGVGLVTYTIRVERVIKGPTLPLDWVIPNAGGSDCGMPSLFVGQRVVLEYYRPGRITAGPWFYAWTIASDGSIAFSDSHLPPLPRTLHELLARYVASAPPDTAIFPKAAPTGRVDFAAVLLLAAGAVAGAISSWTRGSRRPKKRRGETTL